MRKFTDEIRDYIYENVDESGRFVKTYAQLSDALQITQQQARNAMLDIIKQGVLECIVHPSKGKNSSPIYRIKSHRIKATEINPIELDENGVKTIIFEGVEISLILVNGMGYCIEASDLMMCILESQSTFDKILKSNPELFDGHVFEINGKRLISRHGVVAMLMKINLDKTLPLKRQLLSNFQSSVVSVMCDSQLRAKLYISNDNRVKIQHNLNCLLELNPQEVEEMLVDLGYQISKQVEGMQVKSIQQDRQIHKLEAEKKRLESRVETELKSKTLMITENSELKAKLMERN